MKVEITMADFPSDKKNCGNCERRGGECPRKKSKGFPNGYVIGPLGERSGIIYCCPEYEGRWK